MGTGAIRHDGLWACHVLLLLSLFSLILAQDVAADMHTPSGQLVEDDLPSSCLTGMQTVVTPSSNAVAKSAPICPEGPYRASTDSDSLCAAHQQMQLLVDSIRAQQSVRRLARVRLSQTYQSLSEHRGVQRMAPFAAFAWQWSRYRLQSLPHYWRIATLESRLLLVHSRLSAVRESLSVSDSTTVAGSCRHRFDDQNPSNGSEHPYVRLLQASS